MFLKRAQGRRASALLFVLFLVSLVVMFLGALMVVNQGSIRLATGLNSDKNATANCQSGLDYAWQLLERDSSFGKDPFPNGANCGFNSALDRLVLKTLNPAGIQTQSVSGRYTDKENSGFEIYLSNNLGSPATVSLSNGISGMRSIPPRSVLVCVRGFEGKRTRVLETLLTKAPFVSHGLFAGDDVTAQWGTSIGKWDVVSNDPFRNSIRTKGKLTVGRVTSGGLKFSPSGNATASAYGRYGAALPSQGVFEGSTELDADGYNDAARQSRGMIVSRSAQEDRIKTLGSDDLRKPDLNVSIPGGVYRFEKTSFDIEIKWQARETEMVPNPFTGALEPVEVWKDKSETKTLYARAFARYANENDAAAAQIWLAKQHLPQPPASGEAVRNGSVTVQNEPNMEMVTLTPEGKFPLQGTGGLAANINFAEGTFDIPANTMVTAEGDFRLQHRGLEANDERPRVRLVNQTNPDDPADPPVTAGLRARGNLTIEGGLRGSGTVIADGKLEMYAESSLSASSARPVALYAGGDVKLNKDDVATANRTSQATLGEDWTMFKRSLGSSPTLDNFLNDNYGVQQNKVAGLLNSPIKNEAGTANDPDPDYYFSQVTGTFFPDGDPDNLTASAQSAYTSMRAGGFTTDEAIRFREYCRQLAIDAHATTTEYDPVTGEMVEVPAQAVAPRWLDPVATRDEVIDLVQEQLVSYNSLVGQEVVNQNVRYRSMRQWFSDVSTNPYENDNSRDDSVFRGLVYSRNGSFTLNANFNSLTVIGALVVPNGKVNFLDAKSIKTVYDPKYLRDLLIARENVPIKLDQVYWRMY